MNCLAKQILDSSRLLVLSKGISETCLAKGTYEQMQFVLDLLSEEIKRRTQNKIKRAIKRANFPSYKTFASYEYKTVKLPTILSKEELEGLSFVKEKKNLVLYGAVGLGKSDMTIMEQIISTICNNFCHISSPQLNNQALKERT